MKPKSINSLIKYLRNEKGIAFDNKKGKQQLRNIGYYHGFKGYRFIKEDSITIPYTSFNQVIAIYNFDSHLKALFYPKVMFIETALKNHVLEVVINQSKTESFASIYDNLLTDYKSYVYHGSNPKKKKKYRNSIQQRLKLRNSIYNTLTRDYNNNNKIVIHYYHKDENVPIWGIFERISMGEFGNFVSCLEINSRKKLSTLLKIKPSDDTDFQLVKRIIFCLKDLRNAVAHNNIIFDTRFQEHQIKKQLSSALANETLIHNIDFCSITDYIILIVFLLNRFHIPKRELYYFVKQFESYKDELRQSIPINEYMKIIPTNTNQKLISLNAYIKKS